jgi:hypothetical protein
MTLDTEMDAGYSPVMNPDKIDAMKLFLNRDDNRDRDRLEIKPWGDYETYVVISFGTDIMPGGAITLSIYKVGPLISDRWLESVRDFSTYTSKIPAYIDALNRMRAFSTRFELSDDMS